MGNYIKDTTGANNRQGRVNCMNIKQAKEEIKNTVKAYLQKNDRGNYIIPEIRQRPLLVMGPPGIGKTQIMEQAARECRINFVSYTITHHTRQSAVGLPFIVEEEFGGEKYSVTEYTMSEIIASIYKKIEETGIDEGILFIDEINCVSETLAPTMLQFLQCKTFGNQRVPNGWIIAAAGNPPEYNKSVREFDIVTLDRVRVINVEADFKVWKEYAGKNYINSAIVSYLELRMQNFYRIEADVDGTKFVTARGWEDLSNLMDVYNRLDIPVSEEIISEYIQHEDVAKDVAAYIELYNKYQDDYGIEEILSGNVTPDIYQRLLNASFDERLSVVNMLLSGLNNRFREVHKEKSITDGWFAFLKAYKEQDKEYGTLLSERENLINRHLASGFYTREQQEYEKVLGRFLEQYQPDGNIDKSECFEAARNGFEKQKERLEAVEAEAGKCLENAFDFMEGAFGENDSAARQFLVIFVTELTMSSEAAEYLAENECSRYISYCGSMLIGSRKAELLSELESGAIKEQQHIGF